jgi:hypothetical protein
MEIHCTARVAVRAVALSFAAGAALGGGLVAYAQSTPAAPAATHETQVTQPFDRNAALVVQRAGLPRERGVDQVSAAGSGNAKDLPDR